MNRKPWLLVVLPQPCYVDADGVWTAESYDYTMLAECLDSWAGVTVTAPTVYGPRPGGATSVIGERVEFAPLKYSKGYIGAIIALPCRWLQFARLVRTHDGLVVHPPSEIATLACFWARVYGVVYGIDVRGDQTVNRLYLAARGAPLPGVMAGMFRVLFSYVRSGACRAVYVSRELSDRFPLREAARMSVFSDLRIPDDWFSERPKNHPNAHPFTVGTVGRLEAQKGYAFLIRAIAALERETPGRFSLRLVGDGPLRLELEMLAQQLGVESVVKFDGYVPRGPRLRSILEGFDLFALPSITEGMPRALIEAMAAGLPVVATAVGGVPEVVGVESLVPVCNTDALRARIRAVSSDPELWRRMACDAHVRAANFRPGRLVLGKKDFYRGVRRCADTLQNG